MFAISCDEENYEGSYDTLEDAIEEATNGYAYEKFWVGEMKAPRQPETFIDATKFLEDLSGSTDGDDDWSTEHSEWDIGSAEQAAELEASLKAVVAEWLDKNKLRPKWFVIPEAMEFTVRDGAAVLAE